VNDHSQALKVSNLQVSIGGLSKKAYVCRGIDFAVNSGKALAILGESGSGKTSLILAIAGLLPTPPFCIEAGDIELEKGASSSRPALIMQDPSAALNPVLTVESHFAETLRLPRGGAEARACELMSLAGILDPASKVNRYPWQLSGGEQQRVAIALALALNPSVMLADEPTSSLDVTVQKRILALFHELKRKKRLALVIITHELGVAAEVADDMAVMYAGWFLEYGPKAEVLSNPLHPYTQGLVRAFLSLENPEERLRSIAGAPPNLFELSGLCPFLDRCEAKAGDCFKSAPPLRGENAHWARCHLL